MDLTSKQRSYLRGLAHALSPAVQFGKAGLTPALLKEIDRNLSDHELIKVRIGGDDREELYAFAETITSESKAALVQIIGHIAVLYRPAEEPVIELPRAKAASKGAAAAKKKTKPAPPKVIRARGE